MRVTHERGQPLGTLRPGDGETVPRFDPSYEYLSIDPTDASEATSALVVAEVGWKTTLKGLGRQWRCSIGGTPLWEYRCNAACRSGRFGVNTIVAMVDDDHPLITERYGDVRDEHVYTLSAPDGSGLRPEEAAAYSS